MPGGGSSNTTTTQKADPWSGIQPYLTSGYENLATAANNVPGYYPGKTYAGFSPEQQQSQNMALGYAGSQGMNASIGNNIGAMNYGLNSVYDPQSNPVINNYVSSATRPLYETYNEQVMPGIKNQAVASGGLGGSRQGVAEGIAGRGLMNAVGDVSTGIYNNAYNQGLDQQARMAALAPQTMGLGLMPSQIYGDVGAQQQQMTQQGINENMSRYDYNQNADYNRYTDYLNTLQGTPWGSSSSTGPNPNQQSTAAQLGGSAMSGLGTYGLLAANPATAPFALGGGLLMGGLGLFG